MKMLLQQHTNTLMKENIIQTTHCVPKMALNVKKCKKNITVEPHKLASATFVKNIRKLLETNNMKKKNRPPKVTCKPKIPEF